MIQSTRLDKLPPQILDTIKEMAGTTDLPPHMDRRYALDYWLRYEGIIGYTERIIETLAAIDAAQEPLPEMSRIKRSDRDSRRKPSRRSR